MSTPTTAEALKALEALYEGATNDLRAMDRDRADAAKEVLRSAVLREEVNDAPEGSGQDCSRNAL